MRFVDLQHITVRRSLRPILDDVSLSIDTHEHVAIIGANGAGKSTLVQVMSQEVHPLQTPQTKRLIFGKERWSVLELRKKMGIVSAALQYMCTTTYPVYHIVLSGFFSSIGLDFHHQVTDEMREKALIALEKQHILHLKEKSMHTLSSGEARRALLARATVHDPEVMLLDEAVSNLDLPAKRAYRHSLEQFAQDGKTLILVTHDISEIISPIQRVIVLQDGKVIADGDKKEILNEQL
ncbi:MAG: ATP-binding cassette domain-containing protein, partial [Sphaerochaetaceae bacterium]